MGFFFDWVGMTSYRFSVRNLLTTLSLKLYRIKFMPSVHRYHNWSFLAYLTALAEYSIEYYRVCETYNEKKRRAHYCAYGRRTQHASAIRALKKKGMRTYDAADFADSIQSIVDIRTNCYSHILYS